MGCVIYRMVWQKCKALPNELGETLRNATQVESNLVVRFSRFLRDVLYLRRCCGRCCGEDKKKVRSKVVGKVRWVFQLQLDRCVMSTNLASFSSIKPFWTVAFVLINRAKAKANRGSQ